MARPRKGQSGIGVRGFRDTPATRSRVEAKIDEYGLRELADKEEEFLELIGVKPTFERRVIAACAAAIKRDEKGHLANDPNREAFKMCAEIHIASGCLRADIERQFKSDIERYPCKRGHRNFSDGCRRPTKWDCTLDRRNGRKRNYVSPKDLLSYNGRNNF